MVKPNKDSQEQVSLEELLRFKRAERPSEEFWGQFDRDLHQRMMQTLVKKDPFLIQLMRGLSGKFVQTTAIAGAALVLALMVIRPALPVSNETSRPVMAETTVEATAPVQQETPAMDTGLVAEADYQIEVLSAPVPASGDGVTHDFGLDSMEVATYDSSAYAEDSPIAGFATTGVASIVY